MKPHVRKRMDMEGFKGTNLQIFSLKPFSPGFSHFPSSTTMRKVHPLCILIDTWFMVGVKTSEVSPKEQGEDALFLQRSPLSIRQEKL